LGKSRVYPDFPPPPLFLHAQQAHLESSLRLEMEFSRRIKDSATLRTPDVRLRSPALKDPALALFHQAVPTAKFCGSGGVRAVMAENLLLAATDRPAPCSQASAEPDAG
jgi:hypothetical protein